MEFNVKKLKLRVEETMKLIGHKQQLSTDNERKSGGNTEHSSSE